MLDLSIKKKTIAILSTCIDDWGGCEELWSRAVPHLRENGTQAIIYKNRFNKNHKEISKLLQSGVTLEELEPPSFIAYKIIRKLQFFFKKLLKPNYNLRPAYYQIINFRRSLLRNKPNLVLISQAINFDGLPYAYECLRLNIPYIIVSHKAVDFFWPHVHDKTYMRETLNKASLCCFVSYHNLRLTEEQFGMKLLNSRVVFNPVKINRQPLKYPETDQGFRLACIGRLFLIDKGQDILIRILTQEKWKRRPLIVSLVGTGPDLVNIKEMIDLYQLNNICIEEFNNDIESLWLKFHALILPSRSEGLPLTIIEAMAAGRPVIVSNAGGNAEMIQEGVTGFIGEANKLSFDEAMEAAWQKRNEWETMGLKASSYIQNNIPGTPEKTFAHLLNTQLC